MYSTRGNSRASATAGSRLGAPPDGPLGLLEAPLDEPHVRESSHGALASDARRRPTTARAPPPWSWPDPRRGRGRCRALPNRVHLGVAEDGRNRPVLDVAAVVALEPPRHSVGL